MSIFAAGHRLGKYSILRLLGSGGMADVYEAEDTMLGRHVAIKVLPAEYSRNDHLVRRFETEVKQSALLNHRSIVSVYDFGQEGPYLFYTMRLLTGGDLRKRIESGLTPFEALGLLRELADAFTHAHKRTVHRDVKPENIVFDEQGLPVLTDFGIAKALDASTKVTATGVAVGTPRYLSPEQARGKPVDKRADIYSLGVILYEMLTGMPPYDGEEALAVIFKHVTEPIPTLPDSLEAIQPLLNSMMEKDPTKRLASCEDLIVELDALIPAFMPANLGQGGGNLRSSPWMPRMSTPSPMRTPGGSGPATPAYRTGNQPTVITAPPVAESLPKRKSLFDQPGVKTGETYRKPEPAEDDRPVTSNLDSDDATIQRGRPKTPPPVAKQLGPDDETRMRTPPRRATPPPEPVYEPEPAPEPDEEADMTVKMSRNEKRGAPAAREQVFPQRGAPKAEGQVIPPRPKTPSERSADELALARARERANAKPGGKAPLMAAAAAVVVVGIAGAAYFAGAFKPKGAAPAAPAAAPVVAPATEPAAEATVAPQPAPSSTPAAAPAAAPAPTPAPVVAAPAHAAPPAAKAPPAAASKQDTAKALEEERKAEAKRQAELAREAAEKDAQVKRDAEARAAAKKKDEEAAAAARKKQDEEAAAAAARKKQDEEAAAAAARKKQDEEASAAAARKKQDEEAAARKRKEEEAAARQKQDEDAAAAAARKKQDEEAAAAATRKKQDDEASSERAKRDEEAEAQAAAEAAKRRLEAKRKEEEEKAKKRASQSSGF